MKKVVVFMLFALLVTAPAFAELNWGANVETNSTVEMDSDGTDTTAFTNDGRVEVAVESKTENSDGMFVAGKGCFEVQVNGTMGVCDVWFQVGTPAFSLKVGHFEAEGLFSKGQDVYVAGTGASQWYEANKARGRSPDGMGVVFNLGENMTFDTKVSFDNSGDNNQFGVRPVLKVNAGSVSIKAGVDYYLEKPQDSDSDDKATWIGGGVDISMNLGNLTLGGSATYGKNEVTTVTDGVEATAEEKVMSDTAYVKLAMGDSTLGLGVGYTMEDEADTNEMYAFVSYDMPLPVDGAAVKFGAGFASGDNGVEDLTAYGARLRFWYGF
jgi:hypothetical protein